MKMFLCVVTSAPSGPTCFNCVDLKSPGDCRQRTQCIPGQMCYSHKYTSSGVTNFDLGCQSKQVCRIAESRPPIIGRRNVPAQTLCYKCCSGVNCNNILCDSKPPKTTALMIRTQATTTTSTTTTATITKPKIQTTTSTSVIPSRTTISNSTTTTTTTTTTSTTTTTTAPATATTTTVPKTTASTTPKQPDCPTGYSGFESSCYKIVYKSVHWDSAQSHCHSLGPGVYLVSINSQREQGFIETILKDFPVGEIWIGCYIHPFFRRWMWDDRSEVTFTHWDSVFPINDKSRDKMTMVNPKVNNVFSGFYWKNTDDSRYWAFICEMHV